MSRSPVNKRDPSGTRKIENRTIKRMGQLIDAYTEAMKGIYTTSVNASTIDEAPMAYKSIDDIIGVIRDSVDVIDIMKPIYNFKASD